MAETSNIVDTPEAQEAFLTDKAYTEEDLKRVREQEKSKLYPQIDSLKEELNLLKKEREERLAQMQAEKAAAEEEARKKAESEMDVRQLLEVKEQELSLIHI